MSEVDYRGRGPQDYPTPIKGFPLSDWKAPEVEIPFYPTKGYAVLASQRMTRRPDGSLIVEPQRTRGAA